MDKNPQLLKIKRRKQKKEVRYCTETALEDINKEEDFFVIQKQHLSDPEKIRTIFSSSDEIKFKLDKQIAEYPVLNYQIDSWSSFTNNHHPKNILLEEKENQLSRWSVQSRTHNEFVFLQLERISVLSSIVFGKFKECDPTNLKEFKVFVGLDKDNLIEVLSAGMSSDNDYEEFPVKNFIEDCYIPCK
jgi:hypothetical protein